MVSSNLTIGVEFDLTADPKAFTITDLFDYSTLLGYSNVLGNIKAVAPDGTQYHNNTSLVSPDIDISSSPDSAAFPLPLNSDNEVKSGTHTYTYTVTVQDQVNQAAVLSNNVLAKTFQLQGNYVTILATATVLSVIDGATETSITLDGLPTYSSSTGQTTITINESLDPLSVNALFQYTYTNTYVKVFTAAFTYETPTVCIDIEYDQCCTSLTFTDTTAYPEGSTVVRLHTIRYPLSNPVKSNLTSPLQQYITSPVWTGTYTDIFTADIEFESGILTVIDEATNTKEFKVSNNADSCQIATCIEYIANKYYAQLTAAPTAAIETGKYYLNAIGLVTAYNLAIKCDNTDDASAFLVKIKEIATTCGCTDCDCEDCGDGSSVQIVGCCDNVAFTTNTVVLDSPDSSITITSDTVGDTTTFTLIVNQTQLGTFVTTYVGTISIDALVDVDTSSIPPVTGQALIWSGTLWVPGIPTMYLKDLVDVDPALAPTNLQVLQFETASGLWKAVTLAGATLVGLTDVDPSGLATNDILIKSAGDWVVLPFKYTNLVDVNAAGLADGMSFKWDAGTSRFIVFTPVDALGGLSDTSLSNPVPDNSRFQFNTGAGWVDVPWPTFSNSGWSFSGAFGPTVAGFHDAGYAYDPITGLSTIRGAISSTGAVGGPVTIASLPLGQWPQATIPFQCTVGIGGANAIAVGELTVGGDIVIYNYMDPTSPTVVGGMISGIPAGDIAFTQLIQYYINF